ncbi:MAG: putative toxin-antitoxin system toxin component, PIN family [Balneolaceae bacterium]|nr:putative toxin-antitoxin system toxin component, PIN family [Balneolaceae bacterium]
MERPQIVLDTNILYAALRSKRGASYKLLSLINSGKFEINLSVPLVIEYEDVLKGKQDMLTISTSRINQLLDYLCKVGNLHEVFFLWRPIIGDPEDDMILELAVKAQCDYIITYNKRDFRGIHRFDIAVADAKEFLQIIGKLP